MEGSLYVRVLACSVPFYTNVAITAALEYIQSPADQAAAGKFRFGPGMFVATKVMTGVVKCHAQDVGATGGLGQHMLDNQDGWLLFLEWVGVIPQDLLTPLCLALKLMLVLSLALVWAIDLVSS